jgi:hypothetical protein
MTTRFNKAPKAPSTIECRFDHAIALAVELRRVVLAQLVTRDCLRSLEAAIAAIPIAAAEYSWLRTRLCNAWGYVAEREFAAAAYELTLLVNRLRTRARLLQG